MVRRLSASLLTILFAIGISGFMSAEEPGLRTVPSVDLQKYMGTWYEIARLPASFQKKCVSDVRATYTLRSDGRVEVLNQCMQKDGKVKKAKGKAKVVDRTTNAKLKVTFFWPFYGDYWILDLDSDYTYAVVGEPKRKYLWILSRSPEMDPELYAEILRRVEKQGYSTARLIRTPAMSAQK